MVVLANEINIFELVKERVDIVETVGRVVKLKRSGKAWVGLCPFHTEKTPSFYVYEDGGYKCYGCGAGGDVISFYVNYYHLDNKDAVERLCNENAIEFVWGGTGKPDKSRDALYDVNLFAGRIYYEAIQVDGNPALEYLLGRGMDKKTISKFRIGYADDSSRMLAGKLESDGTMQKAADEVGLIYQDRGRYRDRFFGRVMFPIVNTRGKVIGFGGRDIKGNAQAKYINSKGSAVYVKGENLYGLNITQSEIRKQETAILVEGYMDLVMLYKHGITNVCAQLGTAFTPQQAKLLSKYAKSVVLALDSDESGRKAALADMEVLAAAGLKVRVLVLEGAKDPDDFIRTFGKEAFDEAIREAVPMYDYRLDVLKSAFDFSKTDGLPDYVKAAAKIIASFEPVDRDYYMRKLSRETGIAEEAIAMQMSVSLTEKSKSKEEPERAIKKPVVSEDLLCGITGLALGSESTFERVMEFRHMFSGTEYGGLMEAMITLKSGTGAAPTVGDLAEVLGEADLAILDTVMKWVGKNTGGGDVRQIDEYLAKLEIAWLRVKEAELKEGAGTEELLKELIEIQGRIKVLENYIRSGRRGE